MQQIRANMNKERGQKRKERKRKERKGKEKEKKRAKYVLGQERSSHVNRKENGEQGNSKCEEAQQGRQT